MFQKLYRLYLRVVEIICELLLLIILGCMCIQISCRIVSIGQSFTQELAQICFCCLVFFGSPLALAEGAHIIVDILVKALPKSIGKVINTFDFIVIDIFSLCGIRSLLTIITSNKGITAVSITWLKMNWIYFSILISFLAMLIVSTIQLVLTIRNRKTIIDIHKTENSTLDSKL